MRVKKSLGQHFLRSERALEKIVETGDINSHETVLEIGPGMGALTERFLATDCRVLAVEKDDELYEFLKNKFGEKILSGQFELVHGDILDFDLSKLAAISYKLVANIPYNITGTILKKFLGSDYQPKTMVLLVQKEVAQRIIARDGKESILSISVKAYGVPKYIETVKAGSFAPMPKVDSAILKIDSISKDFFSFGQSRALTITEKEFFEVVRAGFKSKRKKLSSNLSSVFNKDKIKKTFQKLNLDDNLRAEDVDIETWRKLIQSLTH